MPALRPRLLLETTKHLKLRKCKRVSCVSVPRSPRLYLAYGAAKAATLEQLLGPIGGADAMDATHVHVGGFYVCKGIHGGGT